jgi:DNA invertase Pin-like site-specific DNA recombinase
MPTDTELIPAIGYIRVSTAREEMISPELQRTAINAWARRTGRRIIDWVEDLDESGRHFKRKIMAAIARIEAGEAKEIAVWKYSRFGRTRTGIEINLARIEQVGGQLQSATEDVDTTTATGWFQRDVIFSVATFESKRAGEQWRETHDHRRAQGLPSAGRPRFGYIWHPRTVHGPDGTISTQAERYEPDSKTAGVVADLYRRYAAGEGFASLAAWLNSLEMTTTRGALWRDRSLGRYMDSGFAAGYLRLHSPTCTVQPYSTSCPAHELVLGRHKPIISGDDWDEYLKRRAFVREAAPRTRTATYPLTALVRCGLCRGAAFRSGNKAGTLCGTRRRRGALACVGTSRVSRLLEEAICGWLAGLSADIEAEADEASDLTVGMGGPGVEQQAAKAAALKDRIGRLERGIAKHMRAYALSEEDDPDGELEKEYLVTLQSLRAEKSGLAAELAELEDLPDRAAQQREAVKVSVGLLAEWDTLPPDRINYVLRQVIRHVYMYPGGRVGIVPVWDEQEIVL